MINNSLNRLHEQKLNETTEFTNQISANQVSVPTIQSTLTDTSSIFTSLAVEQQTLQITKQFNQQIKQLKLQLKQNDLDIAQFGHKIQALNSANSTLTNKVSQQSVLNQQLQSDLTNQHSVTQQLYNDIAIYRQREQQYQQKIAQMDQLVYTNQNNVQSQIIDLQHIISEQKQQLTDRDNVIDQRSQQIDELNNQINQLQQTNTDAIQKHQSELSSAVIESSEYQHQLSSLQHQLQQCMDENSKLHDSVREYTSAIQVQKQEYNLVIHASNLQQSLIDSLKHEKQQLLNECQQLKKQSAVMDGLKIEINELQPYRIQAQQLTLKNHDIESRNKQLQSKNNELLSDQSRAQQFSHELQLQLDSTIEQLRLCKQELGESRNTATTAQQRCTVLEQIRAKSQIEIDNMMGNHKQSQQEHNTLIHNLSLYLTQLHQQYNKAINPIIKSVSNSDAIKLSSLHIQYDPLNQACTNLERGVHNTIELVNQLQHNIVITNTQIQQIKSTITERESEYNRLQQICTTTKTQFDQSTQRVEQQQQHIAALQSEIEQLTDQVQSITTQSNNQINSLHRSRDQLTHILSEVHNVVSDYNNQSVIKNLTFNYNDADDNSVIATDDLVEQVHKAMIATNNNLSEQILRVKQLSADNKSLKQSIDTISNKIKSEHNLVVQQLHDDIIMWKSKYDTAVATASNTLSSNQSMHQHNIHELTSMYEQRISSITQEHDQLINQYSALSQQHNDITTQLTHHQPILLNYFHALQCMTSAYITSHQQLNYLVQQKRIVTTQLKQYAQVDKKLQSIVSTSNNHKQSTDHRPSARTYIIAVIACNRFKLLFINHNQPIQLANKPIHNLPTISKDPLDCACTVRAIVEYFTEHTNSLNRYHTTVFDLLVRNKYQIRSNKLSRSVTRMIDLISDQLSEYSSKFHEIQCTINPLNEQLITATQALRDITQQKTQLQQQIESTQYECKQLIDLTTSTTTTQLKQHSDTINELQSLLSNKQLEYNKLVMDSSDALTQLQSTRQQINEYESIISTLRIELKQAVQSEKLACGYVKQKTQQYVTLEQQYNESKQSIQLIKQQLNQCIQKNTALVNRLRLYDKTNSANNDRHAAITSDTAQSITKQHTQYTPFNDNDRSSIDVDIDVNSSFLNNKTSIKTPNQLSMDMSAALGE